MKVNFLPHLYAQYKNDYERIFTDMAEGKLDRVKAYQHLIRTDLFFVVFFIVRPYVPGTEHLCNHPFVIDACQMVEQGPKDFTLDVWAREHFKSSIFTIGETIQYISNTPEDTTAIFSYARPAAKKFLFGIKSVFENEPLLHQCFPDIFFKEPQKESPLWSLDEGLVLRRETNRKEPTVGAFGLIEGMPTGGHYERRIYDDVVTEDIKDSPEQIQKVKDKFDVSMNLGTANGTHRVIGTFYNYNDPLVYIKDKKHPITKENLYLTRIKPATIDGTRTGAPILLSQERLDVLKGDSSFNAQQLCDPTPKGDVKLNREFIKWINPNKIPATVYRFLLVDPAGDSQGRTTGDSWAIELWGVEPQSDSQIGACNRYLLNAIIEPMRDSEAIDAIVRMYLEGGFVQKLGVEKVGLSSVETHVANALKLKGKHVSVESQSLILLKPAGRKKQDRIVKSLQWPLNNGKIFISEAVPSTYAERFLAEMDKFPNWHDDGLDAASYLDDILKDYNFSWANSGWSADLNFVKDIV